MSKALWIGGLIFALTAGGISAAPGNAHNEVARPASFARCSGCHSVEPGKILFGPSLAGIAGRRAGSVEGYAYSAALKSSDITWDAQTLDRWLAAPQQTIPGTRMPFGGIADEQMREEIVRYLLAL